MKACADCSALAASANVLDHIGENFRRHSLPIISDRNLIKRWGTRLNDDPPSVSIQNVRTLRGNIAEFTVVLSAPTQSTVTVAFATASGTAISGRDFVAAQGKLTFAPGETVKTIRVTTSNGSAASASNQFTIKLSRAVNALFANSKALGTILVDR